MSEPTIILTEKEALIRYRNMLLQQLVELRVNDSYATRESLSVNPERQKEAIKAQASIRADLKSREVAIGIVDEFLGKIAQEQEKGGQA